VEKMVKRHCPGAGGNWENKAVLSQRGQVASKAQSRFKRRQKRTRMKGFRVRPGSKREKRENNEGVVWENQNRRFGKKKKKSGGTRGFPAGPRDETL